MFRAGGWIRDPIRTACFVGLVGKTSNQRVFWGQVDLPVWGSSRAILSFFELKLISFLSKHSWSESQQQKCLSKVWDEKTKNGHLFTFDNKDKKAFEGIEHLLMSLCAHSLVNAMIFFFFLLQPFASCDDIQESGGLWQYGVSNRMTVISLNSYGQHNRMCGLHVEPFVRRMWNPTK